MIKKEAPIYICSIAAKLSDEIKIDVSIAGHQVGQIKGRKTICPIKIDTETINPRKFVELKEKLNIDELLFIDQIIGTEKIIIISDHVNKTGQNYLRSNTPEGNRPTFPDMSKIYNTIEGFEKATVYTVGPERFNSIGVEKNKIYSESIGLVAPIAHYVGIKVFAIGCNNTIKALEII
jgi:hypothetical protein